MNCNHTFRVKVLKNVKHLEHADASESATQAGRTEMLLKLISQAYKTSLEQL